MTVLFTGLTSRTPIGKIDNEGATLSAPASSEVPRHGAVRAAGVESAVPFVDGQPPECRCGRDCEMPCWQRLGMTSQPCCKDCPPLPDPEKAMTDQTATEPERVACEWVNPEHTILVRMWANGVVEVASRPDPWAVWGPPTTVERKAR